MGVGVGVEVDVGVSVAVGVSVGVAVVVGVGVIVGVRVSVRVGVCVGVLVGVEVGVIVTNDSRKVRLEASPRKELTTKFVSLPDSALKESCDRVVPWASSLHRPTDRGDSRWQDCENAARIVS